MIKIICSWNFSGGISSDILDAFKIAELQMISVLIGTTGEGWTCWVMWFLLLFCFLLCIKGKNTIEYVRNFDGNNKQAVYSSILFVWSLISLAGIPTFIYVNF